MKGGSHAHESHGLSEETGEPLGGRVIAVIGDGRMRPDRDFSRGDRPARKAGHADLSLMRRRENQSVGAEGRFNERHARMGALGDKLTIRRIHHHEASIPHEAEGVDGRRGHAESTARLNWVQMKGGELHRHKKDKSRDAAAAARD